MLEFVTHNSIYLINDEETEYHRMPRNDYTRTPSDILMQTLASTLDDGVWLPLREWAVEAHPDGKPCLRLWGPESVNGVVTSPLESFPETVEVKEYSL